MTPRRREVAPEELERLGRAVRSVLGRRSDVVAAWLFGSAARGEPAHDLDLGVVFRGPLADPLALDRIAAEIERDGAPAGMAVDLRPLVGAGPRLRATVLREGRLLHEADHAARIEFETQAMSEWADFRPTWERMRAAMRARWRHG